MPSLERKGNGRRVADSDDDAGAASDGEPIAQSDQLLAKVEPEYLNRPIDLRQGDAYLRKLIGSLHSLKKDVNSAERAVSLVGTEMAELLGEEYDAEAYDEDTVLERLQADVRPYSFLYRRRVSGTDSRAESRSSPPTAPRSRP